MNALLAAVILGVVAAASAAAAPAGSNLYQQYQEQPYQPQQAVVGRVAPAVYPAAVGSQVYPSGAAPSSVYYSGIVRGVAPAVAGANQYYPAVSAHSPQAY